MRGRGSSPLTYVQSSLIRGQALGCCPISQGEGDQSQTPPSTTPPLPAPPFQGGDRREEPKAVVPSTAQSGNSASQDPVNKPLWEAWSAEADEAAGGEEYLGG